MRIALLGALAAHTDADDEIELGSVKQRGLLAQLALEPNRPVNLDRLADGTWEQVPARYRQNLQVYVSNLRRLLEPHRTAGAPSRIVGHREAYELVAADDEIDALRFVGGVTAAEGSMRSDRPAAALGEVEAALAEWSGDPLADVYALPFAAAAVTALEGTRVRGLEVRATALLALGRHHDAIADLERLIAHRPDREQAWCGLAVAQVRSGRQQEALETVRRARRVLLDEYGLDPGPELAAMEGRVLEQDPTLLGERPPVVRVSPVPRPIDATIGRDADAARLADLLAGPARLITLSGPGGIGKTRLALEVLRSVPHLTATWLSFADAERDMPIADALATALGTNADGLAQALTGQRLAALDNLEHITDAGAQVAALLWAYPELRVLATSRGPLGVRGEEVYPVPPLDSSLAGPDLFTARARAVFPAFDATANREAVVELCAVLDGLPLAIELAASRVGLMSPAAILADLPSLAAHRDDHAPSPRQSSLTAAVEWSLQLLDQDARTALAALAALDGPIDLASAEAAVVEVLDRPAAVRIDAIVESLTRVALLQPVETAAGRRFTMLRTIKAVVLESAPADVRGAAIAGVAKRWLALDVNQVPRENWSAERIASLAVDVPVLRQVVGHLVAAGRGDDAARLVCVQRRGFWALGSANVFEELLRTVPSASLSPAWRSRQAVLLGCACYVQRPEDALTLLAAVDDLALGDAPYRVHGLCNRAAAQSWVEQHEAAVASAEAAIAAAAGDDDLLLVALGAATWVTLNADRLDLAARHATAAMATAGRTGNDRAIVIAANDLALAELFGADGAARAASISTDALLRARRFGTARDVADVLLHLGWALLRLGRVGDAVPCLGESLLLVADDADWGYPAERVAGLALAAIALGDTAEGKPMLDALAARLALLGYDGNVFSRPIEPVAIDLGVVAEPAAVPIPPAMGELVARARTLAERLAA